MYLKKFNPVVFFVSFFIFGCVLSGVPEPDYPLHHSVYSGQKTDIHEMAGQYYTAVDVRTMRNVVEEARKLAPDSAIYHEIASDLAYLEDRRSDHFNHLVSALRDLNNDIPLVHLHGLSQMHWTLRERETMEKILLVLLNEHTDPTVRTAAAHYLSKAMFLKGSMKQVRRFQKKSGWSIPFTVIGTWDNDQDKGFDLVFPPEKEIKLQASYPGRHVDIFWRGTYPRSVADGSINLRELLYPNRWSVAYLASALDVKAQGRFELRIMTSDALKIWINGVHVFENRHISRELFDGIVVPVVLRSGVNRILIKSAQKDGPWIFNARLTRPGGGSVASGMLNPVPPDTPNAFDGSNPGKPITIDHLIEQDVANIKNKVRKQYFIIRYAGMLGLNVRAVRYADQFTNRHPSSVSGRYQHAVALWGNGERGRTSDILNQLLKDVGMDLPLVAGKQARFWRQNNFKLKSRELLLGLIKEYPDRPMARVELAKLFKSEGWTEDRLKTLKEINKMRPGWVTFQLREASVYEKLGYPKKADDIYREMNYHLPNDRRILSALSRTALKKQAYGRAECFALKLVQMWPDRVAHLALLGNIQQSSGNWKKSEDTFTKLIDMAPTSPVAYRRIAELNYLDGDEKRAIRYWKKSLDRDPDNEKLANRLDFLSPPVSGPWAVDIPDEGEIQRAIASRGRLTFHKGADTVMLLDDMVVQLNSDGSRISVETSVTHVLNKSGRDRMTKFRLNGSGQSRILKAYSVDPQGRRVEASSIRGRTIRFRKLKIGSTVVVQYRNDSPPSKYLAEFYTTHWYFQVFRTQIVKSRYVLWAPAGTRVSEYTKGDVKRAESTRGTLKRIVWNADQTPVLVSEENMPPFSEIGWMLSLSTVPGWDMFHKWEEALLQDAFRESPEIVELAEDLFKHTSRPMEKILRIQEFLITEIRYQKDYEQYITGVKPHAAPIVLARRYGDCKDKAVLFITLAKLGGIEAHFALVRTRDYGRLKRDVPMQQFNHAIVYVPAQKGLEQGFFIDPTVDALDVDLLRSDNQGTWSLVLDLQGGWHWFKVPFQAPAEEYIKKEVAMSLASDGQAHVEMTITAKGRSGAAVRRTGRNHENYIRFLQNVINHFITGSKLIRHRNVSIKDVRQPAKIKIDFKAPVFARKEGKELRFKIPETWWANSLFSLEKRIHPLVLGTPRTELSEIEFRFPPGSRLKRVPGSREIKTKHLSFTRRFSRTENGLKVADALIWRSERVPVDDYGSLRNRIDQIKKIQDRDVVITVN